MRRRGLRVDRGEPRVERGAPEARRLLLEARAQRRVAPRRGDDAVEQRAQVEAGAAGDDGQPPARRDVGDGGVGERDEARRVHPLPRLDDVEEVVRDRGALLRRSASPCPTSRPR